MAKNTGDDDLILVVGATGRLGREIVRLVSIAGKRVRALVRSDADPSVVAQLRALTPDLVPADLRDSASLHRACANVTSVVSTATAIMPRREGDSIETVDRAGQLALVKAAASAGVRRFIFLSFLPNDLDYAYQRAKRAVEHDLQQSGMSFTIIQSAAFMEVWLSPLLDFDLRRGSARILGAGTELVSWVSLYDVARFSVAATENHGFANRVLPLGGPDALAPLRIVSMFEEIAGKKVQVEHLPVAAIEEMFRTAREPNTQALAAKMLVTARGQVVPSEPAQSLLPGRMITVRDHINRLLSDASA